MSGLILDRTASVWRTVGTGGGNYALKEAYLAIKCAIVPISSFDSEQSHFYESTHIVWTEHWLVLRKEDEIRYGRRPPDAFNNVIPWTYVVNGRRSFSGLGVAQTAWYCKEKD